VKKRSFPRQRLTQFFHSIRFRLVLWFVVILGVVMVTFSGFVYWRQAQEIRSIALGRLNYNLERLLEPRREEDHEPAQTQPASPDLSTSYQESDVLALQATDGTILQNSGALTVEQIRQLSLPPIGWKGVQQVSLPQIPLIENNQYLFINPALMKNGLLTGYLLLGVPLDANNQLERLLLSLVLGNLLTITIALVGGFWLADRAMRPVHTITQAARQIGETDLHQRLNLPGIDELSELANTFDAMLNRLQAAFERQRQFTADASHELRTPLTIIDLETSRMLSARRSADEYESALRTVQSENQFMIRLVNNLLALARMDAGQVSLKFEPLDLGDLALEVVERLEPLAAARGVKLAAAELPEIIIQGDRSTLIQLLTNLVENAIKYSATVAAPTVLVSAGSAEADGRLMALLRVSDNGPGIAPEHLAHLFDRFYQADAARSRPIEGENGQASSGTGLGLAIAQWVAQAHHGEIRVESAVGQGSQFTLWLPVS
jgi:signal transduction histidine kinase